MKKFCMTLLYLFFFIGVKAQTSVILPEKFTDFKEHNKYNLNQLTFFALQKEGIDVFSKDSLNSNQLSMICRFLKVDIQDESNSFTCKLKIVFKNCNDIIVYTSDLGTSKEKSYNKSYSQAFRNAEKTIDYKVLKKLIDEVYQAETSDVTKSTNTVSKPIAATIDKSISDDKIFFEATKTPYGYQLQDNESVKYLMYNTSLEKVYLVTYKNQIGIVYRQKDLWILELPETNNKFEIEMNFKN